jgi:hypothetical protein
LEGLIWEKPRAKSVPLPPAPNGADSD